MNTIAIVIPYYKIDFFEETLKTVTSQTDKRFTLYIGNDASPDDPFPLIEKYFPDGNYYYFDYKENLGGKNLAMQWERILENVNEEWFQILGDDDVISENFVEEFYTILPEVSKDRISLIKTGILWIDSANNAIENNIYKFNLIPAHQIFIKKYKGEIRSSLSENIYKTKLARQNKFEKLPLAWGTDDLSLLNFSENGIIKYIAKPLVMVRVFDRSISGSKLMKKEKKMAYMKFKEKLFTDYCKYLPKEFIIKELPIFLDNAYFSGYIPRMKVVIYLFKIFKFRLAFTQIKKIYYIKRKYGA